MNTSRKSWPISLLGIFTIWLIAVVGGGIQVRGQPAQLDELVKNQIMFGMLVAVVFLSGAITYLKMVDSGRVERSE